jgi:hypothetical protein
MTSAQLQEFMEEAMRFAEQTEGETRERFLELAKFWHMAWLRAVEAEKVERDAGGK